MSTFKKIRATQVLAWIVAALFGVAAAHAGLVTADFNDLSVGPLKGQAGGAGFTGTWYGSSDPDVENGDLAYAGYYITQTGTPQRVDGASNDADRQDARDLATAQSGEIWFSVLVNVRTGGKFAGLTFNTYGNSYDPITTGLRVLITTNELQVGFNGGAADTGSGSYAADTTHLILGQLNVGAGSDAVSIWIDPALPAVGSPSALPAAAYANSSVDFAGSITNVGVAATGSGSNRVDSVRVSDTPSAFYDVTGVAAPPSGTIIMIR